MLTIYKNLKYPFVYLDSSFLLRSNKYHSQIFNRKYANKHNESFLSTLNKLKADSDVDSEFYNQIMYLQQVNIISTLITYETCNRILFNNSFKQVSLFGSVIRATESIDCNDGLILWDEEVNYKNYNTAAISIAEATCIVADPIFFEINVGKALSQYISINCKVILLGNIKTCTNLNTNYTTINLLPQKFMHDLISIFH